MRFLILTQYFPPEIGAAQARLSAFSRELVRARHAVTVVTAFANYPSGELGRSDRRRISAVERDDGFHVHRVWHYTATGAGAKRLASYLSFTATGLVGAVAGSRRPDVVFVESPPLFLGAAGWLAARRWGAAFILNVSDLWPDSVRELGFFEDGLALAAAERLERWLYRRATAVTAVTEGIQSRLTQAKGVPPEKVLFLPNGVAVDTFRPLATDSESSALSVDKQPLILYTGNLGYAQALDTLIEAAVLTPEITVALVGAGSDGARIRELARSRGVANVHFGDPVAPERVPELYAQANAGIVSLRRSALLEGARPAKTLAIMGCGKPVIYAGAGEGAQLVEAAGAGIVVPPEDPVALAAAFRRVVADPPRAASMGESGRRYVEENLSWPALTASWLEQLERLLAWDRSTVDASHHGS